MDQFKELAHILPGSKEDALRLHDDLIALSKRHTCPIGDVMEFAIRFARLGLDPSQVLNCVNVAIRAAATAEKTSDALDGGSTDIAMYFTKQTLSDMLQKLEEFYRRNGLPDVPESAFIRVHLR